MSATAGSEQVGRILVVDDYPMNRLKLSRVLQQQGHSVALAENGRQALDMLRQEPFDVVMLDIVMPEMDGHQVLEAMKSDNTLRDIPVIVISAVEEVDSAVRCIEMGAEDYLPKPFNPVFLRARLSASLRRKHLRDLEQAYLDQEIMLRQSEKLATLGKMSAGMAHELNNPAAAIRRGVAQLQSAFDRQLQAVLALARTDLSDEQVTALGELVESTSAKPQHPLELDPLARSDLEAQLEDWLDDAAVADGWQLAPELVSMGFQPQTLEYLCREFSRSRLPTTLNWLTGCFTMHTVLKEVSEGSTRMSEIVKALKSYAYMDQAPVQNVDIHQELDNTLVMLRSKLKQGITVHRRYAADLPRIEAYGSELNQVWTNLIDNAISAMDGEGEITLTTCQEGKWVVVEIADNGPGIPETIQSKVFDPFFTTKPPGQGTGLGLNICHNIIVQKHNGKLSVRSEPGETIFTARLPMVLEAGLAP